MKGIGRPACTRVAFGPRGAIGVRPIEPTLGERPVWPTPHRGDPPVLPVPLRRTCSWPRMKIPRSGHIPTSTLTVRVQMINPSHMQLIRDRAITPSFLMSASWRQLA
jgi:hypothetical protein